MSYICHLYHCPLMARPPHPTPCWNPGFALGCDIFLWSNIHLSTIVPFGSLAGNRIASPGRASQASRGHCPVPLPLVPLALQHGLMWPRLWWSSMRHPTGSTQWTVGLDAVVGGSIRQLAELDARSRRGSDLVAVEFDAATSGLDMATKDLDLAARPVRLNAAAGSSIQTWRSLIWRQRDSICPWRSSIFMAALSDSCGASLLPTKLSGGSGCRSYNAPRERPLAGGSVSSSSGHVCPCRWQMGRGRERGRRWHLPNAGGEGGSGACLFYNMRHFFLQQTFHWKVNNERC
jgi:hypothetical protein